MLTAQQILSSKKCGDLFSSADKQVVIAEYREIARAYHPDISSDPQANEVMAKVNQLYEEALKLIESGAWEVSNQLILRDKSGKKYIGKYLKQFPFELGEAYIANSTVTYVFKENHKRFFDNAVSQIKGLRYANKKMEEEMSRFMPRILYALSLDDIVKVISLSEQEVEAIKAIKNLFPNAEYVERIKNSNIVGIGNSENGWIADINNALFPSLKPGNSIDIDDALAM